jgi:TonB family protein
MTTTPRGAAPRATPLLGSLAVHAVLVAVAAALPTSFVAAGDAQEDESPMVLAWVARHEPRQDDVVVKPPAERRAQVPAPRREIAEFAPVVLEEPVVPPHVDVSPSAPLPTVEPPSTRPAPGAMLSLHPGRGGARRGPGGGGGGGFGAGVGGNGGDGTGGAGGYGLGSGEGDDGDGQGVAPRSGATRGPAISTSLAAPPYPRDARSRGWQGRVVLVLGIGADGNVTSVEVAETSGHDDLDDAARAAARDWTFAPALRDGEPVAGTLRVPVRFELTD